MSELRQEQHQDAITDELALLMQAPIGEWMPPTTNVDGATETAHRPVAASDSTSSPAPAIHQPVLVGSSINPPNDVNTVGSTNTKSTQKENSVNDREKEEDIPEEFLCPITQELMTDPVLTPYGHSYQRSAIIQWLAKPGNACPMTRNPLGPWQLETNQTLRRQIRQWQMQRGDPNPIPLESFVTETEQVLWDKEQKKRFLLFTRVLIKYLETRDPAVNAQVKAIVRDCVERNRRRDPGYESVTAAMKSRMKRVVSERYWNRAENYLYELLQTKRHQVPRVP